MKVLMVSQPTEAGVAQCVADWSAGLVRHGDEVVVACPGGGHLPSAVAAVGIEVLEWPAVRAPHRGVAREARSLRGIVRRARPDVVHLHGSKAGLTGRLLLRGRLPTAFSPHAWSYDALPDRGAAAAAAWERLAARWTHGWICVSSDELDSGRARGIDGPMHLAINGVDTDRLRPPTGGQRAALRTALAVAPEEQVAVCVARLARQKGVDVLLDAWREVAGPGRRLVLVGDGPDAGQLRQQAADLRRRAGSSVEFVGALGRDGALDWMRAADVVVAPSRWEGMALVPLESLAVGTPVVATDVAGVRELLDEACGSVVAVGEPRALARAVDLWLTPGARDQAAAAARRRVVGRYDLARTVAEVRTALASIAQRG